MIDFTDTLLRSKLFWIVAVLGCIYWYFKKVLYTYWADHGVPHDEPVVPIGTLDAKFIKKETTFGNHMKDSYEKFKSHPFHGMYMFHQKVLMINDPELIKSIFVKDFTNFCDRGLYSNDKIDPLSGHLFLMNGNKWRTLRAKLSPTFTAGKLKQMFPLLLEIADEMINVTNEELMKTDIMDMKDIVSRYTTDTIFSLAFGFNCNSLKNPTTEFRKYGNLAIQMHPFRSTLIFFAPQILDFFRIPFNPSKVTNFFTKLFKEMVEQRRANKMNRKDFLNLLIELIDHEQIIDKEDLKKDMGTNGPTAEEIARKLGMSEATAQAFVFLIAGFETSSSIVAHCLYELALNPDVQEKLYEEVSDVLQTPGGYNYESLSQMDYLNMVFCEAMRKHPSVPFLNRICINDYKIPNSKYVIPKGMRLAISVSGLHLDPNIYPEPNKFDPTRFNKENTESRHPYTYLPFGEGPRICIGKRLGILQSKIALFTLISQYKFSVCEKTPIPIFYSTDSVLQTPKDSISLRVEKRKIFN